jgi:hypothetical protein
MFGIDTITIAFLFACAFLLNRKEPEKKKTPEEKFADAVKDFLTAGIQVRIKTEDAKKD